MTKRKKRRAVPRGSSNSGRPRKEGLRYPSGDLRPPPPNARVMAERTALVGAKGDITKASSPLDFALERGWITEAQHRCGVIYASLYSATSAGAPRAGSSNYGEVDTIGSFFGESLADMKQAEIAAAFDKAFAKSGPAPGENRGEAAMAKWRQINAAMSPIQQSEVHRVCVMESWPQWVIQRAAGHTATGWERKRDDLVSGLDAIGAALRPAKAATTGPLIEPLPDPKPNASKVSETVAYVDADGHLLYEAEIKRRRP